ncbi:S-methyl-5'-thioadenosine phosphorylase [Elusimicrobiota bacterium]
MAKNKGSQIEIGIIGGTGLYEIEAVKVVKTIKMKTPFGLSSSPILIGDLKGTRMAFLARHGKGHSIPPTHVNSCANIYALKSLGVRHIIGVGATGSLKEEIAPTNIVIPDQFLDRTKLRTNSFFGLGLVAHVSFNPPTCPNLSDLVSTCAEDLGFNVHRGGTYVCIEGPAFSTLAESMEYRKLGCSVIGMTALPEAKLAREAEICYSTLAFATDYDVWKEGEEVSVEKVMNNLKISTNFAKQILLTAVERLAKVRKWDTPCPCVNALKNSIITNKKHMDKAIVKKLGIIVKKHIK